jgi:hypothetical protein
MRIPRFVFVALVVLGASFVRVAGQDNAAPSPASATPPAAANSDVPTATFNADRYSILWTKSPFAVATSETVGQESPDYFLVGVANQDGIFYASVIERQNQEHFLLSSDKPNRGMTLKTINRTKDGLSTFAEVVKDGQPLTLKLEEAPAAAPGAAGIVAPNVMSPQIPMPGGMGGFPGGASARPFIRFHRPAIHLPPMPQQQQQPAAATPPPPPPPPPQQ